MPKPIQKIEPDLLIHLKNKISDVAGLKIESKNDCASLSQMIFRNAGEYLSESTLYRFFFKGDDHQCYKNTLDKLSRFCGTNDWDEFCWKKEQSLDFLQKNGLWIQSNAKGSLLQLCIHNQEFKSLQQFFDLLPTHLDIVIRRKIGLELYQGLLNNRNSNNKFYELFSHSVFVRTLLFEELADPDFNIKDQEKMYQWYLKNTQINNEIKWVQDFVFANALLFRYYYITGRVRKLKTIGKLLFENNDLDPNNLNLIHIFPRSRWYAYRLLYSRENGYLHYEQYLFDLMELCRWAANELIYEERNIVLYNALDVLRYLEELELINQKIIPLFFKHRSVEQLNDQSIVTMMKWIEPNGLKKLFFN